MKRFVVPPNWPTPPRRSWVPPKTWRPDPSWAPAPEGWKFWDDGKGNPVRGPIGRYGGMSRRAVIAGAGGIALFLAVNIWALSAIGLFDGGQQPSTQAAKLLDDSTPTPSVTATPTAPTTLPSVPPPVHKTTVKPSSTPTKTRTTKKVLRSEERNPAPTKTPIRTVKPPRPTTSPPPTRDQVIREYCRQQGWDPSWCNPDNWPPDPNGPGGP